MGNNETIEISINDEIMEKNVNVRTKISKNPNNEKDKEIKIINYFFCMHKEKLAITWNIVFVLEFLLC
jgi:hypothetical protein